MISEPVSEDINLNIWSNYRTVTFFQNTKVNIIQYRIKHFTKNLVKEEWMMGQQ